MMSIRDYIQNHPAARDKILFHNKSYTFFKISDQTGNPRGNINVPLTRQRSIATDTNIFPKAGLAYIITELPVFDEIRNSVSMKPFSRFVLNQDTGGAIKGPGRVDLFWGNGKLAEKSAGTMRSFGKLFFLVAKKNVIARFIKNQLSG